MRVGNGGIMTTTRIRPWSWSQGFGDNTQKQSDSVDLLTIGCFLPCFVRAAGFGVVLNFAECFDV